MASARAATPNKAKLDAENYLIADWLVRLKNNQRNWGFELCFLHLRNVKDTAIDGRVRVKGGHGTLR